MTSLLAIVPKRTLSGGTIEISRLLHDASQNGITCTTEYFFPEHLTSTQALFLFPYLLLRIVYAILVARPQFLMLTHYTTFYLALFPFRSTVVLFLQGPEWLFPSPIRWIQVISIAFHSFIFRYVKYFIVGSSYLLHELQSVFPSIYKKHQSARTIVYYPVGDCSFVNHSKTAPLGPVRPRDIDLLCILRNGWLKNYPAYIKVLDHLSDFKSSHHFNVVVVNLSSYSLPSTITGSPTVTVVEKMPQSELFSLFLRTKIYLSLSLCEGLGLPPLEAMSFGAIPIVLENGGVSCYLSNFENLILPADCRTFSIVNLIIELISLTDPVMMRLSSDLAREAQHYFAVSRATRKDAITFFSCD